MRAWVVLGLLAGCFSPTLDDRPFRCGGATHECPPGYTCDLATGFCGKSSGTTPDAGGGADVPGRDAPMGIADAPPTLDARTVPDAPSTPDGPPDARTCVPGALTCSGDDLTTCDGSVVRCPVGCAGPPGSAGCQVLVPTGLSAAFCRAPADAIVDVTQNAVVDTTDCTGRGGLVVPSPGGLELCAFIVNELTLREQVTLAFTGSRVPVLLATHRLELRGRVDVGGSGVAPGAGVVPGSQQVGDGADGALGTGTNKAGRGGGGGGHITAGGVGGGVGDDVTTLGGLPFGFPDLRSPEPGAFGGRGGQPCNFPPCPVAGRGGAGGAVHIVACEELRLGPTVAIDAGGGGGPGGRGGVLLLMPPDGGGGGGSGGSILVEAPEIDIPSGALIGAIGGGGGGGGGISLDTNHPVGESGQPGGDGRLPSAGFGGNGGSLGGGGGGAGGKGASDALAPGFGGAAGAGAAGGGGGAAGRIRLNVRPDRTVTFESGSTVVPAASTGSIVRQQ